MKRIARFEKVSKEQFLNDWLDTFGTDGAAVYETISIPRRATSGSAGYDICTPCDVTLVPGETAKIPTGIRVFMEEGSLVWICIWREWVVHWSLLLSW